MAYEDFCAACTYMGESSDYTGKYYCSTKGEDRYACDARCYSFCEAYSRSNYSRENMYNNSLNHSGSSGCYLTTIICQLLGYPDNNYYLNTLRNFRDNVMKTNINYIPLLLTYDTIGPIIASQLRKDNHGREIAETFFSKYIVKSVDAISESKEQDAIKIYTAMTNALAENYNINTNIVIPTINEIDVTQLGHGRVRRIQDEIKSEAK